MRYARCRLVFVAAVLSGCSADLTQPSPRILPNGIARSVAESAPSIDTNYTPPPGDELHPPSSPCVPCRGLTSIDGDH